jgi:integrase
MASIRKRGSKWQVQVRRLGCPPLARSFLSKEDGIRWSREQERRIDLGEIPKKSPAPAIVTLTVTDLLNRYEAEVTPGKRSKSDLFHLRQIRRHQIGIMAAQKLTAADVARYRDDRLKSVSGSTVRKELTLLGSVLKLARDEWCVDIHSDPVKVVRKPSAARGRDRRLNEGEFDRLSVALHSCRNPLIRHVFLFALATGMRRGEVLSLIWRNVDVPSRTALLPLTKNGEPRLVPLSPAAMDVLAERQGINQVTCDDLMFPISANAFRLAWERVRRRAGIEDLRFHDLRHEAISRFFEFGLSVPEVALISGHKDTRMLFRYTHLKAIDVSKKLANTGNGHQYSDP